MAGGKIWLVVGGLVAVVVMVFGWFVAAAPQLDQAAAADQQRAGVEALNAEQEAQLLAMQALDARKDELADEYDALKSSVPTKLDLVGYFDWLAEAAAASAITLTTATAAQAVVYERTPAAVGTVVLDPEFASQLRSIQVDISIGGTADQVATFLRILQKDGRLQLIETANVNLGSTLTARVSGYIFAIGGPVDLATPAAAEGSEADAEQPDGAEGTEPDPSMTPTPPAEG